ILSTVNPEVNGGNTYGWFSGTSMATPHAAGVLALIWSSGYGTGPAAVRDRLFSTADAIGGTGSAWTYGRIDAFGAVASGAAVPSTPSPSPSPTETPEPTATPTSIPTSTPTSVPPLATATATVTSTPPPTVAPTSTPLAAAPEAPQGLSATARRGFIRLNWTTASTANITYNVYRGTAPGEETLYATGVDRSRFEDHAVTRGTTYAYYVTAHNDAGESAPSNRDSVRAR
ncbi:MAG: S8 family serine peptidase, partial [Chloroflexota bacterium]